MSHIIVSLDSGYVKRNGESSVYVSTRVQGRKIKFKTGVSVKPEDFDPEKGVVRRSHPNFSDLNLIISSSRSRLDDIFIRYRLQFEELTVDLLNKEYKILSSRIEFHSYLKEAIRERRGEITDSTIEQHIAMANKLKQFSPKLTFSQIDEDFLTRFNRWMISSLKNEQNTRYNTFKSLKTYINIAIRKRIINHNHLSNWTPAKQIKTNKTFLTEGEVEDLVELYDLKTLQESQQRTLRYFLFMCFTGLRISDLRSVEMEQIINGTLVFGARKTRNIKKVLIKIPLPAIALRLIREEAPYRLYGRIFTTLSEYQLRKNLKEIAKASHINKDINLHTGRHTFATMFLRRSKNVAVLQKLLGHSRIEMTMTYAHVLTEDIEMEVKKAFERFS
ncbi:MAG: site-specific integrase [Bacteroidales bacterium]|nr:site-specific integrase [Bacteroidales bacterium]